MITMSNNVYTAHDIPDTYGTLFTPLTPVKNNTTMDDNQLVYGEGNVYKTTIADVQLPITNDLNDKLELAYYQSLDVAEKHDRELKYIQNSHDRIVKDYNDKINDLQFKYSRLQETEQFSKEQAETIEDLKRQWNNLMQDYKKLQATPALSGVDKFKDLLRMAQSSINKLEGSNSVLISENEKLKSERDVNKINAEHLARQTLRLHGETETLKKDIGHLNKDIEVYKEQVKNYSLIQISDYDCRLANKHDSFCGKCLTCKLIQAKDLLNNTVKNYEAIVKDHTNKLNDANKDGRLLSDVNDELNAQIKTIRLAYENRIENQYKQLVDLKKDLNAETVISTARYKDRESLILQGIEKDKIINDLISDSKINDSIKLQLQESNSNLSKQLEERNVSLTREQLKSKAYGEDIDFLLSSIRVINDVGLFRRKDIAINTLKEYAIKCGKNNF